jgi:inhibitor of cysteine peptidase
MNIVLSCILLCLSMIAQASDTVLMNVKRGEKKIVIPLAANPTTGYQWSIVSYNHNHLKLVGSRFKKPTTNRIGAGGQMLYTFAIKKVKKQPDSMVILFKYARPWEAKPGTMKKVTIHIQ